MKHAKLSASSAERWMNCPGSVPLSAPLPNPSSEYAAEGTFAHEIGSRCLTNPNYYPHLALGEARNIDGFTVKCDQEMVDGVAFYLETVRDDLMEGDTWKVDVSLNEVLAALHPDLGGNADYLRWRRATGNLLVVDFKYGAGIFVAAEDNKQMLTYALGALLAMPKGTRVKDVTVKIVQPRLEFEGARVREWTFPAVQIMDFMADILDAAEAANKPGAPLVPGDVQCQFCPAKRICPALEAKHHALIKAEFSEITPYNPAALALALQSIPLVKARIKAIEEFAYSEAMKGKFGEEHGYKLVDKRPTRRWKNDADVIEWAQKAAVDPYAPRELLSPAQLEKRVAETAPKGKKKESGVALAPFIESKSSGLALVPLTDDRSPAKLGVSVEDFAVIDGTAVKTR